ncbi:MAG: tetratricopeptide repeat protein [Anaerolineae bacterium]
MKKQTWLSPVNLGVLLLVVILVAGFAVGRFILSGGSPSTKGQGSSSIAPAPAATLSEGEQASAYFTQARAAYDEKNYETALRDFTAAVDLSPGYAMAYLFRGLTYAHLGENELAIQDLKTYLDTANDDINRPEVENLIRRLESGSP